MSEDPWADAVQLLLAARDLEVSDARRRRLVVAAKSLVRAHQKELKRARRTAAKQRDREVRDRTGTGRGGAALQGSRLPSETYHFEHSCYICKRGFRQVHHHYHQLCPECADLNFRKRSQQADLSGRVALVTGGRVRIGHEVALKLLRCGAKVAVTTRFPGDALTRFRSHEDYSEFKDRLDIVQSDFCRPEDLNRLLGYMRSLPHLDVLVNNAAQTVRPSEAWVSQMLELERQMTSLVDGGTAKLAIGRSPEEDFETEMTEEAGNDMALATLRDELGQPLDPGRRDSWMLRLDEISPVEALEVQLVNVWAPMLLAGQARALCRQSPFAERFVVNVSAMEGQFSRARKTSNHPHLNMAKAALNMLTRTSAADYAKDDVYMNSVDTGWVTDERPGELQDENAFLPPLDAVDGAARILDPVFLGIDGDVVFGRFLKDYREVDW